jgi:hypothetical protein
MEKRISPIQLMSYYRRTQLVSCATKWTLLTVSYNLLQTDTNSHARPPSGSIVSGSQTEHPATLNHLSTAVTYCMYRLLQPFKAWWLLYVPPGSEFKKSTSCP